MFLVLSTAGTIKEIAWISFLKTAKTPWYHWSNTNGLLQIANQLLFQFFAPEQLCWTLDESHGYAFSIAHPVFVSLSRKPRCQTILEKFRWCRFFLCVAALAVLLFDNEATICISSRIYCRRIAFVICMTDFAAKMLQVRNILCHQVWSQVF